MKVTARFLRSILLSVMFLTSFGLIAPTLSLSAQQTRSGHEFDYYSDDTFSCLVGVQVWCNDGSNYGWGQVTPYSIISDSGC
jgi:hypothetical protein